MAAPNIRNASLDSFPNIWTVPGVAQYVVVIQLDWGAKIYKRAVGESSWGEGFDLATIPGNPMKLPVDELDDHYVITICVDAEGYIWLAGNAHGNKDPSPERNFIRSAQPHDITSWIDGNQFIDDSDAGIGWYTYNIFLPLKDGTVVWLFSQHDIKAVLGRDSLCFRKLPGSEVWTPFSGNGELMICDEIADNGDPERAFFRTAYVDADDVIHVCGVWQWEELDPNTRANHYYIRSKDGGVTWETVSGHVLQTPLTYETTRDAPNCELADPSEIALVYGGVVPDDDGNPHIELISGNGHRHYWWDGASWQWTNPGSTDRLCRTRLGGVWRLMGVPQGQVRVRNFHTNQTLWMGYDVPVGYRPQLDPVLQKEGVLAFLLPDGDIPQVFTFGDGARAKVAD